MIRWYIVTFLPAGEEHTRASEWHCNQVNGMWTTSSADHGKGKPASHILVSIANLLDANDLECIALQEIDRAGNPIHLD